MAREHQTAVRRRVCVCVYVFASVKGSWIGSRQGALLCVLDSEVLGAAAAYTLMGCRGNNMFVLEGTCVWMDSICHGPSSQEDRVCTSRRNYKSCKRMAIFTFL